MRSFVSLLSDLQNDRLRQNLCVFTNTRHVEKPDRVFWTDSDASRTWTVGYCQVHLLCTASSKSNREWWTAGLSYGKLVRGNRKFFSWPAVAVCERNHANKIQKKGRTKQQWDEWRFCRWWTSRTAGSEEVRPASWTWSFWSDSTVARARSRAWSAPVNCRSS